MNLLRPNAAARWTYTIWGALIFILGAAPALRTLTYQRMLNVDVSVSSVSQTRLASLVDSGIVGIGVVLGVAGILVGLGWHRVGLPKAGLALWLGAMAFALGYLPSAFFGLQPDLSLTLLGFPIVFTAVYLLPSVPLSWFMWQAKRILLIYAYGSLVAAVVAPGWAIEFSYDAGLVPGFNVRLHGLATHANLLSPLLLTYLVLSWFSPSKTRWDGLHKAVALMALILTQSKTAWILLALAYLIRLAYAYTARNPPMLQRFLVLALLGSLLSGTVLYVATGPAWVDAAKVFFSGERGEELMSLTGRTLIWQITVNVWEENPLLGYGPSLWNLQMGRAYAPIVGFIVPHAHSQVFQSLGASGIVGVTGMFLYVLALLAYGVRCAKATYGVALALVLVLVFRGYTEPSLGGGPGDTNFYVQFLTFAFLMLTTRRRSMLEREHGKTRKAWPLPGPVRNGPATLAGKLRIRP